MTIGNWIRRTRGKWHLVESVVAEDAITRCGRRMDRVTASGGELQVSEVMPLTRMIGQPQLCKAGCDISVGDIPIVRVPGLSADSDPAHDFDGPDPFGVPEDDASTWRDGAVSPIMSVPCRRHDNAFWDEALDQWVCEKCGYRWAVRRDKSGRALPRQGASR
jgi:hypothetical protein